MKYILIFLGLLLIACSKKEKKEFNPDNVLPKEIIDLSSVISSDLPTKLWGKAAIELMGFKGETEFRDVGMDSPAFVRNSYIEVFNHGGAHLDAPNHTDSLGKSIEDYELSKLLGPVKIFDASKYENNVPIPLDSLKDFELTKEDIFILYTNYKPPQNDIDLPSYPYLSVEACNYLTSIPVKAIATDAWSIESLSQFDKGINAGLTGNENLIPNHYNIFKNEIPLYEALENVGALLDKENIIFIGFPLKFKNGNGSPVRAVAFVY
ncbi:cyclase family protein [Aestuariivivens sediminis]|uniref:cyclase family protein n=1 Tax=Aestuariivivens sediminis TaxID=2913557 RepID=UPI001F56B8ED|nr:cyclase family protein [Aestuariivivens sediminis]